MISILDLYIFNQTRKLPGQFSSHFYGYDVIPVSMNNGQARWIFM